MIQKISSLLYNYKVTASPPAASIAAFAVAVNLCAVTFNFAFNSPLPRILTVSLLVAKRFSTNTVKSTVSVTIPLSTNN